MKGFTHTHTHKKLKKKQTKKIFKNVSRCKTSLIISLGHLPYDVCDTGIVVEN